MAAQLLLPDLVQDYGSMMRLYEQALDLLDVSAPNYFLGESLFLPRDTGGLSPDTLFHGADGLLCSDGGAIRSLTASEKEQAEALLIRYFTARLEPPEES